MVSRTLLDACETDLCLQSAKLRSFAVAKSIQEGVAALCSRCKNTQLAQAETKLLSVDPRDMSPGHHHLYVWQSLGIEHLATCCAGADQDSRVTKRASRCTSWMSFGATRSPNCHRPFNLMPSKEGAWQIPLSKATNQQNIGSATSPIQFEIFNPLVPSAQHLGVKP